MPDHPATIRRRFDLRGQVQGVGFRPYVYRLATTHALAGHVANNTNGAAIEVEGSPAALHAFECALLGQLPPLARVAELSRQDLEPLGEAAFRIRASEVDADQRPEIAPDAATCVECRRELLDAADRRYRYPFINCTNCGPRYSIIRSVPYDRPQTTMAIFEMCPPCAREYADPAHRRFHAQPNACAVCGPQLRLYRGSEPAARAMDQATPRSRSGLGFELGLSARSLQSLAGDPIHEAARMLADGKIIAIKGIGGYHLACRADREDVVRHVRERKLRDGKPLAVMVPDLRAARRLCRLTPADMDALSSPAAPIVLAPKADGSGVTPAVAPGCCDFGIMLPYAPVHHLLFAEGLEPLVMTSANLAGHPLTYRDDDALEWLADVADAFLMHNREICRPIDDSVVLTFRDEIVPIRRARGYAPRPIRLAGFDDDVMPSSSAGPASPASFQSSTAGTEAGRYIGTEAGRYIGTEAGRYIGTGTGRCTLGHVRGRKILAVGGELKATVCLLTGGEAVLSEHLGDLTRPEAFRHFVRAVDRLKELCGFEPEVVACDLHPRYLSTDYARRLGLPVVAVQHHHAHVASVMAEWGEFGPVIGLACDGTGFGSDRAVWGCEVLLCERGGFERLGHLKYFPLIGGDAAAIETWRPAAALVRAACGEEWKTHLQVASEIQHGRHGRATRGRPSDQELQVFEQQAAGAINAPPTSSLGRVFDAVSFLLGLCERNRHEAEAAMTLEAAASSVTSPVEPFAYDAVQENDGVRLSLLPTVREIVRVRAEGEFTARIAARFHETVARLLADAARLTCEPRGVREVGLSGGCFANRRLLTRLVELLETDGLRVLYHRQVPCGDGGLALGQALVAAWQLAAGTPPDAPSR